MIIKTLQVLFRTKLSNIYLVKGTTRQIDAILTTYQYILSKVKLVLIVRIVSIIQAIFAAAACVSGTSEWCQQSWHFLEACSVEFRRPPSTARLFCDTTGSAGLRRRWRCPRPLICEPDSVLLLELWKLRP